MIFIELTPRGCVSPHPVFIRATAITALMQKHGDAGNVHSDLFTAVWTTDATTPEDNWKVKETPQEIMAMVEACETGD